MARGSSFSFNNAIIKLLPKLEGIKDAAGFRPISMINSDQKIFSLLIANRFKQVLALIIESDQYAYLPGRNIHVAINDLKSRVDSLMDEECVISVDLSKAFDRVDRVYLFHILRHEFPWSFSTNTWTPLLKSASPYQCKRVPNWKNKAGKGHQAGMSAVSAPFHCCPRAPAYFLRNHPWSNYAVSRRVVAYADDVTVFLQKTDIDNLFAKIKFFGRGTQFKVNRNKSQVLCADE